MHIAPPEIAEKIKQLILLELALGVIEHDKKMLPAEVKMKEVFADMFDRIEERAVREQSEVRKWLRANGVRNWEWDKRKDRTILRYWYRGYGQEFSLLGSYAKAEIEKMLLSWK